MLWRRPLQCSQLCQCSLKRDDASRSQPGHSRFPVAITGTRGRGGGGGGSVGSSSSGDSSNRRRRLLWRFPAALLDQSAGVAEHFGEPAVLVVQPVDFGLERAERDFERAPHKATREDVRLFVVEPAVDDALLGPTELVVCRFTKPTFFPPEHPADRVREKAFEDEKVKLGVRTALSPTRGLGWKPGPAVATIGRDSTIRFGLLPMCQE